MTTEPQVKIQLPVGRKGITSVVRKNVNPTMVMVESEYNDHQSRYPDAQKAATFPIRLHGYQIISTTHSIVQDDLNKFHSNLVFRVKPMPYAFNSDTDHGVSESACQAILLDLRRAIFRCSPVEWDEQHSKEAAAKLIDYWINNGRHPSLDKDKFASDGVDVTVFLERPGTTTPPLTCTIQLGGDSIK